MNTALLAADADMVDSDPPLADSALWSEDLPNIGLNWKDMIEKGGGTYSTVYVYRSFAIKKIVNTSDDLHYAPWHAIKEIAILKRCNHENIVKVLGIGHQLIDSKKGTPKTDLYIIMPLYDYDLNTYLDKHPLIDTDPPNVDIKKEATSKKEMSLYNFHSVYSSIAIQIIEGLQYLHSNNIVHLDIKPSNILIKTDGTTSDIKVALCDFSLSYNVIVDPLDICATRWYRPPEMFFGHRYADIESAKRVDIWSLGCVLYEMAYNRTLFRGDTDTNQLIHIFKLLGTPTYESWPKVHELPKYKEYRHMPIWKAGKIDLNVPKQFNDIIKACLRLDPEKRATIDEIIDILDYKAGRPKRKNSEVDAKTPATTEGSSGHRLESTKNGSDIIIKVWLLEVCCSFNLPIRIFHFACDIYDKLRISKHRLFLENRPGKEAESKEFPTLVDPNLPLEDLPKPKSDSDLRLDNPMLQMTMGVIFIISANYHIPYQITYEDVLVMISSRENVTVTNLREIEIEILDFLNYELCYYIPYDTQNQLPTGGLSASYGSQISDLSDRAKKYVTFLYTILSIVGIAETSSLTISILSALDVRWKGEPHVGVEGYDTVSISKRIKGISSIITPHALDYKDYFSKLAGTNVRILSFIDDVLKILAH